MDRYTSTRHNLPVVIKLMPRWQIIGYKKSVPQKQDKNNHAPQGH